MIQVGVIGAAGRMGRQVCDAVRAEPDLRLCAMVDIGMAPEAASESGSSLELLKQTGVQVAVDFTTAQAAADNVRWCVANGIHAVVGTSGISSDVVEELGEMCRRHAGHVLIAPNFAIGAVLAIKFAGIAAAWMPDAEIIELHHRGKLDSPSGTALGTLEAIARGRRSSPAPPPGATTENLPGARGAEREGVHVHSVRLPGLVAHQEVLFGGPGQTLSIRHDSTDRTSFMPGVILAVREIGNHPGLTVGLQSYLGL